jgi:hypothetical protein
VTPFAAGCAVCGFDLEEYRRRPQPALARARRSFQMPQLSGDRRLDVFLVVVLFLLVAFSPLIGALIAAFVAWGKHREGDMVMRNVALGFLGLDVLAILLGIPLGLGVLELLGLI